jgi:hypothetical protein
VRCAWCSESWGASVDTAEAPFVLVLAPRSGQREPPTDDRVDDREHTDEQERVAIVVRSNRESLFNAIGGLPTMDAPGQLGRGAGRETIPVGRAQDWVIIP